MTKTAAAVDANSTRNAPPGEIMHKLPSQLLRRPGRGDTTTHATVAAPLLTELLTC